MSITNLIPGLRGNGSRRAVDEVDRLREDNIKLLNRQAAADDFFAFLWQDVVTTNAAWEQEKQLRGEAEEAAAQMRMERDEWRDEALRLRAQFGPQLAAEANANRVTVPPMVRDTSAVEDQATGPIDVRALWDAAEAGRLG
ncbi:hypothetical protein ACFYVK_35040 [Streptomyces chartreusis]|uniref:hypothetical protein n=1 Tax=Streptomyces chartreusis TaxID=1969 RepID=UPI0036918910